MFLWTFAIFIPTKLRGKIKDAKMANIVPISLKILSNQSEYKNLELKKNQDKYKDVNIFLYF